MKRPWTAGNGSGTVSTPLYFDDISDPELIRLDDYDLNETTMRPMLGLPLLQSEDLVDG